MVIYENKQFEEQTYSELNEAANVMQTLVDAFNALNLGDVQPNELGLLAINPQRLYDDRLAKIEIPQGFRRDKYLEIMELPDLTDVLRAQKLYKRYERYGARFFDFRGGKISVNTAKAKQMAEMHTVSVDESSPAFKPVKRLLEAMQAINEANDMVNGELIRSYTVNLDGLCMELTTVRDHVHYHAKIKPYKIKELIKKLERQRVVTVNNS
ncbi:MAG TPA: hypothetical protein ENN24_06270 [Bacteroidetes bacterium]|nr:hypothetical protein [Bacteroidota bacterium]